MHAHRRYAKASYGRGAGVPLSCRNGTVDDDALCYTPCKPTFNGVGPVCWDKCSSQHGGDTFDGGECDRQTVDQPSCSRVVLAIPTAHRMVHAHNAAVELLCLNRLGPSLQARLELRACSLLFCRRSVLQGQNHLQQGHSRSVSRSSLRDRRSHSLRRQRVQD